MCQSGGRASRQLHKLQPGQYAVNMAWTRVQYICFNLVNMASIWLGPGRNIYVATPVNMVSIWLGPGCNICKCCSLVKAIFIAMNMAGGCIVVTLIFLMTRPQKSK